MLTISKPIAAALVGVSVVLTSAAQLLFRYIMMRTDIDASGLQSIFTSLSFENCLLLSVGVTLYCISMLAWIFALTRFSVSVAYPMLSLSYILVYAAATLIPDLGETASLSKLLGVGFVMAGIVALTIDKGTIQAIDEERH